MTRRAFVMPVVILLTLGASFAIAVAFERHSAQRLMVQRQIVEYRRHHDMLGAQTIIRLWLSKQTPADLARKAARTEPAHRFSLPGGLRITIYLEDGQGTAKVDLTEEQPPDRQAWFQELLYRLPENRPDLIRRTGPAEISVNAAPREVLAALREGDRELADVLMAARLRASLSATTFRQALEKAGVGAEEVGTISQRVVFEPTIWKLTVEAEEGADFREFTALAEVRPAGVLSSPSLHEWREVRPEADEQRAGRGAGAQRAGARTTRR